jgi:hypothetical protein
MSRWWCYSGWFALAWSTPKLTQGGTTAEATGTDTIAGADGRQRGLLPRAAIEQMAPAISN